jgi:hypothetical protein
MPHPRLRRPLLLIVLLFTGAVLAQNWRLHPQAMAQSTQQQSVLYLPLIVSSRTFVVTGSLQDAADAAQPGNVLVLNAATYSGDVNLQRSGTATAPITLRGAGIGQSIIKGNLRVTGAYWNIQDLDVNVAGDGDAVRIEAPSHHVNLRRLHLYGGSGYGVRVGNDTSHVLIEDSQIDHFDAGDSDAHGVGIMTASNVTIRRCDIHHNSGDAIQSNTPDYPGYGRFASNILIENSRLHDNRENALDIKSTHGLTLRNNLIWGYRAVDSSDGMAIQVQHDAQDIQIIGNQIWDAVEGIELTDGKKSGKLYPAAPQRVRIAGNVIRDLVDDPEGDSGSGSGIVIRASSAVQVYNNTVLRVPGAALYLGVSSGEIQASGIDLRNNVFDGQVNDLHFSPDPSEVVGLIVDYNHYVNGLIEGTSLGDWLAKGFEGHATSGDPRLDENMQPRADSPLRDSGVNVGLFFTGSRPDRGWGELAP